MSNSKLSNKTLSHGDVLVFRPRNVGKPSKASHNARVTLRKADREELKMMQLDPVVFPIAV